LGCIIACDAAPYAAAGLEVVRAEREQQDDRDRYADGVEQD
jgi:hypothetical protein